MNLSWRSGLFLLTTLAGSAGAAERAREIVLTVTEFPPVLHADLPGQGPWAELVRTVFAEAGYPLQVEFRPWTRVLGEAAAARGAERVVLLRPGPGRSEHFLFSEALTAVDVVLLRRRDNVLNTADLDRYRVGYMEHAALPEAFLGLRFAGREAAQTHELNLRKLLARRIDCILIDRDTYRWYTRQWDQPEAVAEVEGFQYRQSVYLGIPLNSPKAKILLRDFNTALARLQASGRLPAPLKPGPGNDP